MLRLSELSKEGALPKTANAQYPGTYCSFRAVAGTLTLIKNAYALLLGPAICLYNAKLSMSTRSLTSDPRPNNLLFLNYTQDDIIFGFHDKVRETILEIDRRYRPEILFVVTTCLQEIVGEDFEATIEGIRPDVKAKLLVIHTENFTCEDATQGIENVFTSLFELMEPQSIEDRSVNILGLWTSFVRSTELALLLNDKGLKIKNVIPSYCIPSELASAPEAKLNIVLDQYSLPLAEKMNKAFGTEYIYSRKPYRLDSIEEWYQRIAGALDINLDKEIWDLKSESEELMTHACENLSGKTCALSWNTGRTFNLAGLLNDLGIEIEVILLQNILTDDFADIEDLLARGTDPLVFRGDNSQQTEELLGELRPDIYVGAMDQQSLAQLRIESRSLTPSFFSLGFECTREVLRLLCHRPAGLKALMFKEKLLTEGEI